MRKKSKKVNKESNKILEDNFKDEYLFIIN